MKKLYVLLSVLCMSFATQAQDGAGGPPEMDEKRQRDIEALKVAFITRELQLTPDEAQKFWPVYNQYFNEVKTVVKENKDDALQRDEKVLNLKKKYKESFVKIIGVDRVNRLFNLEHKFKEMLLKSLQKRQQMRERFKNRKGGRDGGGPPIE